MPDFDMKVKDENGVIVVTTNGYLNNYGGEQVASVCMQKISEGKRIFDKCRKHGNGKQHRGIYFN